MFTVRVYMYAHCTADKSDILCIFVWCGVFVQRGVCIYVCVVCVCTCAMCMYVYVFMCMYVYMYVFVCMRVYVYVCVYTLRVLIMAAP